MSHPPDPALADSFANWAFFIAMFVVGLWRRRKQNDKFADQVGAQVEAATKAEVEEIHVELGTLQQLREADATRSAIMTDRMNQLEGHVKELIHKISSFETALPHATEVLEKVLITLERLKTGTLVEKQVAPGVTKLTKEKP